MNGLLITFHVIFCFFMIFVVLLQVGRGAELGAAFGSMGQAQNQRGQASVMSKITAAVAILFMLSSFFLTYNTSEMQKATVLDKLQSSEAASPAVEPNAPAAEPMAPANESAPNAMPGETQSH